MKKALTTFIALLLVLSYFPVSSLAASTSSLKSIDTYLTEIGMTEEEMNEFLEYYYDENLNSFSSVGELKDFLGEPITDENLQEIVSNYHLENVENLKDLLVENGEMEESENIEDVFHFITTLDETVSFYTGTPITDENLQQLLDDYGFTYDELVNILKSNDDSLENYEYIEDLETALYMYTSEEDFTSIFTDLGITDDEMEKLMNHFMNLNLDGEGTEQKLMDIAERMMALGDFESEKDLTEEQVKEILNAYQELLNLFQLDAKFYLVKGEDRKSLSYNDLMKLQSTNGYDLLIELYNQKQELLADMVITSDMFGSELITDTVEKVVQTEEKITQHSSIVQKTVKGGKLPNTAGHYYDKLLIGLVLVLAGAFLLIRKRRAQNE